MVILLNSSQTERGRLVRANINPKMENPGIFSNVRTSRPRSDQHGFLMIELFAALTILALILIPISFSFLSDQRECRSLYYRSVAMEIVDGEIEILRAGEWRQFKEGAQNYFVHADAAKNLPTGTFVLTRDKTRLRLEWIPARKNCGGKISREIQLQK